MHGLLWIISILVLSSYEIVAYCQENRPLPARFDGTRFYNIDPIQEHSPWKAIKWRWTRNPVPWPNWIKDVPADSPPKSWDQATAYMYIGHATVLIQTQGINILTDPHFTHRASPVSWAGPQRVRNPALTIEQLPPIDIILISHNHYDHLDLESLKLLLKHHQAKILIGLGNKEFLNSNDIHNVEELDWWEKFEFKNTKFYFTPTRHFSSRGLFDRMQTLWGSFYIKTPKQNLYFAGDTGYGRHFKMIQKHLGIVNLAFLPIGAYKPRWFMKDVHLNPEEAVKAHLDLKSKHSVGIHFATFDGLTDEGIYEPEEDLAKSLTKYQLTSKDFKVPDFGKIYSDK